MTPGIFLVCDPQTPQARALVAGMVEASGTMGPEGVRAATGRGWAAAVVGPPTREPTCGGDVHTADGDVILWAGEIMLPDDGSSPVGDRTPQRCISVALLQRLQSVGIEGLGDLDGAFCGAWFDRQHERWVIFNDRMGLLPVFWSAGPGRLVVAPRARLTWQAGGEPLEINDAGVADLLRTENMVDDHTLIEGVHWLEGGHAVYWGEEGCGSYRYWDFGQWAGKARTVDPDEAAEHYLEALRPIMKRCTAGDGPLRLGISGGIDSRMYLAMAHELGRVPSCFTAGFSFAGDVRFGRRLAQAAGAPHAWLPLNERRIGEQLTDAVFATDGLHSVGHLAPAVTIRHALAARPGGVLLEGYLHGFPAGQYIPADEEVAWDDPPHQRTWAQRFLHAGGSVETINRLLHPDLATDSYRRWKTHVNDRHRRAPFDDRLQQAEYTVISGRSGRIDALGTALFREHTQVRTPACHRALLEWAVRTAPVLRRGKHLCLKVIDRCFRPFARVGRTDAGGLPIARDRWLREVAWQREKLHRQWVRLRHPWTRRCGTAGKALRVWTFHQWRRTGQLDVLTEPDARVLQWVQRPVLLDFWHKAKGDPAAVGPLLSLATLELMIRELHARPRLDPTRGGSRLRFERIVPAATKTPDKTDLISFCS